MPRRLTGGLQDFVDGLSHKGVKRKAVLLMDLFPSVVVPENTTRDVSFLEKGLQMDRTHGIFVD
eukprot:scaffold2987_cov170-Amphora_coffeaeformis.AAC.13